MHVVNSVKEKKSLLKLVLKKSIRWLGFFSIGSAGIKQTKFSHEHPYRSIKMLPDDPKPLGRKQQSR